MAVSSTGYDSFEDDFPQAGQFLDKLRKQLKRVNTELDQNVTLHTNSKKGVMYIRGTEPFEAYMWALHDYLNKIPGVVRVEFKLPLLSLECVQFQFASPDNEVSPITDQQLQQCVQGRVQQSIFHDVEVSPIIDQQLQQCVQGGVQQSIFHDDALKNKI